jgi:hypothetical protein
MSFVPRKVDFYTSNASCMSDVSLNVPDYR